MFDRFQVGGSVAITSILSELQTEEEFTAAREIFDPQSIQSLSEDYLTSRIRELYLERKRLSLSLIDMQSIVSALGHFLTGAV